MYACVSVWFLFGFPLNSISPPILQTNHYLGFVSITTCLKAPDANLDFTSRPLSDVVPSLAMYNCSPDAKRHEIKYFHQLPFHRLTLPLSTYSPQTPRPGPASYSSKSHQSKYPHRRASPPRAQKPLACCCPPVRAPSCADPDPQPHFSGDPTSPIRWWSTSQHLDSYWVPGNGHNGREKTVLVWDSKLDNTL